MIVNVCPAAVTSASPESIWRLVTAPERFGEWTDATYLRSDPPGPAAPGQVTHMTAHGFGRRWRLTIEVRDLDPGHRWIDLVARLPLGVDNHEHLALMPTETGGTLVRFN